MNRREAIAAMAAALVGGSLPQPAPCQVGSLVNSLKADEQAMTHWLAISEMITKLVNSEGELIGHAKVATDGAVTVSYLEAPAALNDCRPGLSRE
jgi:hypothetical protein